MTFKERFIEWAEKRDRKLLEDDAVSGLYKKNRRYHRYFEGYTEYPRMSADGRLKIVRVYTGVYYRADLSALHYALSRAGYILLWILAVICQATAIIADYSYNYTPYVTVFEALGIPASFALMLAVFNAALTERRLKIRQYRTVHNLTVIIAMTGAVIHLVTALSMILNIIIMCAAGNGIWAGPVKLFIAATCFFAVWFIERRIPYITEENPEKSGPGGIEIVK